MIKSKKKIDSFFKEGLW